MCICEMDVATSFLMLASVAMMAIDCERDDSITTESSCWRQSLFFFSSLQRLNEK